MTARRAARAARRPWVHAREARPGPGADDPPPTPIGHNGGPPLDPPADAWALFCWKKAHEAAWKTPCREIVILRLERAKALGVTYRQYTAFLMNTGRHPTARDLDALAGLRPD